MKIFIQLFTLGMYISFFYACIDQSKNQEMNTFDQANLLEVDQMQIMSEIDFSILDEAVDQFNEMQADHSLDVLDQEIDQTLYTDESFSMTDQMIEMPVMKIFYGDITISTLRNVEIFNQNAYTHVEGNLKIENLEEYDSILNFESLVEINGDLIISNSIGLQELKMNQLKSISGSLIIGHNQYLQKVLLASLERVGIDFRLSTSDFILDQGNQNLREIAVPNLIEIGRSLYMEENTKVLALNFSRLTSVYSVSLLDVYSASMIDFSSLVSVADDFVIRGANIEELQIPQLEEVGGSFYLSGFIGRQIQINLIRVADLFSFSASENISSIELPFLVFVSDLAFDYHKDLISISIPNVDQISGSLSFYDQDLLQHIHLPNITTVGSISLNQLSSLQTFEMPQLTTISLSFKCANNYSLTNILLPNLHIIHQDPDQASMMFYNSTLQNIQMESLVQMAGTLSIYQMPQLQTIEMPILQQLGRLSLDDNPLLLNIIFPSLTSLNNLRIYENQSLISFEFPNLNQIENDVAIRFNPVLESISMPLLTRIGNDMSIRSNQQLNQLFLPLLNFIGRNYINVQAVSECYAPLLIEVCQGD